MIVKDASKGAGSPGIEPFVEASFILQMQESLTRELNASEEVKAKMCAHASTDGVGTKATGYAKPENGPFCCIGCEHVSEGGTRCDHPEVVEDPDVEKDGKLAIVEPLACCNEYRPKGKDGGKE